MPLSNTEKHRRWLTKLREKAARADAAAAAAAPPAADSSSCDPVRVLQEIALDRNGPTGPRVAACKALLALQGRIAASEPEIGAAEPLDRIAARAVELMQRRVH